MNELSVNKIHEIDHYWIHYVKETGEPGHIQLSACANNYALSHDSPDGQKRCVGVRYEKDGFGCYELYNVGHTLIKCPLKPNFVQFLLRGKKAVEKARESYLDIERKLNEGGWMTIEK